MSESSFEIYNHLLNNPNLGNYEVQLGKEVELLTDLGQAELDEIEEKKKLVKDLELPKSTEEVALEKLEKRRIAVKESVRTSELLALSEEHLLVWKLWYKLGQSFESYGDYGSMPVSLLRLVTKYRQEKRFEKLEVWRHSDYEDQLDDQLDASLFGFLNGNYYLLARWAEKGDNLISLDQLVKLFAKRKFSLVRWLLFSRGGGDAIGTFFAFLAGLVLSQGNPIIVIACTLAAVSGVGFAIHVRRRFLRLLKRFSGGV